MSLYNTDIKGNANISRNSNVGSHLNVNGDAMVGHNLFVKGWVDAPNIKGPLKGLYASEATLNAAYPRPMPGWFALVGNTLPAAVWRVDGGKWTPTGETGGQFNLWLDKLEGDLKELTDDVRDLEELLDNGLLLSETITFDSTGTAAWMKFKVMARDGSTKELTKSIPIVTSEKAGMMSAADKQELTAATAAIVIINTKIKALEETTAALQKALDKEISDREAADTALGGQITDEAAARKKADDDLLAKIEANAKDAEDAISGEASSREEADEALQTLIDNLRKDFDALVGENASEAIDNFTEVLSFLDGLTDTEKLSSKLAELSGTGADHSAEISELQRAVWPLSVALSGSPLLIKAGTATNIHLEWEAERKGVDVTAQADVTLDGAAATGKSKETVLTLGHGASKTFSLRATYSGMSASASVSVRGSHPSYFGTVAKTWEGTEANIKALAEILAGERELTRNGIAMNDGRIALSYPKDFGALTSVNDGNGYEVLSSYTRSEVTVNGIVYYLYVLTVPVTASGVTQIYK